MKNGVVRPILLVLAVGAAGLAAAVVLAAEREAAAERQRGQLTRVRAAAAIAVVAELHAGQRGYVAVGQTHEFWTARVTELIGRADSQVRQFRESVRSDTAAAAVDSVAVSLENFRKLDARAQEYASLNQPFLASDLIFSDGLEMTDSASRGIQEALGEEGRAHEAHLQQLRRRQAMAAGAAGGVLLLAVLLFFPIPVRPDESRAQRQADEIAPAADARDVQTTPSEPPPASGVPEAAPDLSGTARLCIELGRVVNTSELPPLLARAAELLDASGLVVWIGDGTGAELRPALSHGYTEKIVAQMRRIPRDAPNATALTFRSAEAQVVPRSGVGNGAFVAPLLTPAGCVGAFAAELRHGNEQRESTRALATILAAQIATLVTQPPPIHQAVWDRR
jgi:hypothetical protein